MGSKIRSTNTLRRVEIKGDMIETMTEILSKPKAVINPSVLLRVSKNGVLTLI